MPADALTLAGLDHPALFGKLPAHGDFIARGVPGAWRDRLDAWLSEWIATARTAAGDAFADRYEAAAPWLFESPRAVAVLLPSVDAVGRLFPLLAIADPGVVTQAAYDAVVEAVGAGTDCDSLRAALAALPQGAEPARASAGWFLPEGAEAHLPPPDSVPSWRLVEGCFA